MRVLFFSGSSNGAEASAGGMEVEEEEDGGITKEMVKKIVKVGKALSKGRHSKDKKEEVAVPSKETIQGWSEVSKHQIHSASSKGITCVDVHSKNAQLVLTGGVDKVAKIFDRETGKVRATLKGHTKKINAVAFHGEDERCFTASADKNVRMWTPDAKGSYKTQLLKGHSGEVNDLVVHPCGDFLFTASSDTTWYDVLLNHRHRHHSTLFLQTLSLKAAYSRTC